MDTSEYVDVLLPDSDPSDFTTNTSDTNVSWHLLDTNLTTTTTTTTVTNSDDGQGWDLYFTRFPKWFITVSFLNLIGNVTILYLIRYSPTFRKPANYLIGNLSAASLLYMATMIVRRLERIDALPWTYGAMSCAVITVVHKVPGSVVSLTLTLISLDRSRVIRNPFDPSKISARGKIFCIWLLSVVIVLPYAFTKSFDISLPEHYRCVRVALWDNPIYNILYGLIALLVIHIIPVIVLLSDVSKMLRTMKVLSLLPKIWNTEDRRVTLMRNSCIYALVFIVCWLPIGICRYPLDLPKGVISTEIRNIIKYYWEFLRMMGYFYVAVHPILLFLLSHDLRQKVSLCFL